MIEKDYRKNILIDKDNPVLAFKANRDRFVRKNAYYNGYPQLSSEHSEDAITWNYFRSMDINNDYSSFAKLIDLKLDNPQMLLWTMAFNEKSSQLQYECGKIIREIDGKNKGQITEPDVIIKSDDYLIVIECKLGIPKKYPEHLWAAQKNTTGPAIRHDDFFIKNYFIGEEGYYDSSYQLFRMAFYANKIAELYKVRPAFISLTNKTWWQIKRNNCSPENIWNQFCEQCSENLIKKNVFWQDIKEKDKKIQDHLKNHCCL